MEKVWEIKENEIEKIFFGGWVVVDYFLQLNLTYLT